MSSAAHRRFLHRYYSTHCSKGAISSTGSICEWKPIQRLSQSAFQNADIHSALGGLPAVINLNQPWEPLHSIVGPEASLKIGNALRDVCLDVRPTDVVARSGGSFQTSSSVARPSFREWLHELGRPLVFDTNRKSDLHRCLRETLGFEVPAPFKSWSRSPIATLGKFSRNLSHSDTEQACSDVVNEHSGGLAFHRHERNWLFLVSGMKRWYFHIGGIRGAPATALDRVTEAELREREVVAAIEEVKLYGDRGPALLTWEQRPGECILVPDGVWHCTYNMSPVSETISDVIFGVGGMGFCAGEAEFLASVGDVGKLETLKLSHSEASNVARIAAEQGQIAVLSFLKDRFGIDSLVQGNDQGATPLHYAAASGSVDVVELLVRNGADVNGLDAHGTTPAHWSARSGSSSVLKVLREAGADLEARDEVCACQPLHLLASEGHIDAIRWLVEVGGVEPSAKDSNGRCPREWAVAGGHDEIAAWLSEVLQRIPSQQRKA